MSQISVNPACDKDVITFLLRLHIVIEIGSGGRHCCRPNYLPYDDQGKTEAEQPMLHRPLHLWEESEMKQAFEEGKTVSDVVGAAVVEEKRVGISGAGIVESID